MKLSFDKQFYSLDVIQKSVQAYKDLADFSIEEKEQEISVRMSNIDEDVKDVIADEFSNYILARMQEKLVEEK